MSFDDVGQLDHRVYQRLLSDGQAQRLRVLRDLGSRDSGGCSVLLSLAVLPSRRSAQAREHYWRAHPGSAKSPLWGDFLGAHYVFYIDGARCGGDAGKVMGMGKKREYVVLRAIRAIRRRDPFSELSGIRFRESMIAHHPQAESTMGPDPLSRCDADAIDADAIDADAIDADAIDADAIDADAIDAGGTGEVGAIAAPFDGGGLDVAALETDIERAHDAEGDGHRAHRACTIVGRAFDGARIDVARRVLSASSAAASSEVISIAALQRQPRGLGAVGFSTPLADISARREQLLSPRRRRAVAMSGTSMTRPHVAGLLELEAGPTPATCAGESGTGFGMVASCCTDKGVRARGRDCRSGGSESQLHLASKGGAGRASMAAWSTIPAAPASVPGLESGLHTDQLSPGSGCRAKWS
jgi:hypothetical protein